MRRFVVALLVVIVVLPPLSGVVMSEREAGAIWRGKTLLIRDFTDTPWRPFVAQTVAAFNAMLPKRAPRLIYRAMDELACPRVRVKRGIAVCNAPGRTPGAVTPHIEHHEFSRAVVRIEPWDDHPYPLILLCHEFMHATTDIPDDPDPIYSTHEAMSCVWGQLDHPGPFDRAYAHWVYGKYGGKERRRHR